VGGFAVVGNDYNHLPLGGDEHYLVHVDFYQTGAFTAMIPEIEPIGKAKLTSRWDFTSS